MGLAHSPSIVIDGLLLYLDAANTKSYPGSGTAWNDLSGNGRTATMFGSVPFSTDVAPCFNFATATGAGASSSSLGFTFGSNMIPTTGNFTLSCWIKNPNPSTAQVGLFSNTANTDGYRFGLNASSVYYLIGPTYQEGNISFSSSLSSTLWYNVVSVYSRTTAQVLVYLNGVYQNAASIPVSQTAMQNGAPGLVRSACCTIYTGKLAGFSAYGRALSTQEITQNYNALKGRFGL